MDDFEERRIYPNKGMLFILLFISMIFGFFGFLLLTSSIFNSSSSNWSLIITLIIFFVFYMVNDRRLRKDNPEQYARISPIRSSIITFIILGVFILLELFDHSRVINKYIFGTLSMLMFGYGATYILYRLVTSKPSIIIKSTGFSENSSVLGAGEIVWEDIDEIFMYTYLNNKFIGIVLNTNKVRQLSRLKRFFLQGKNLLSISDKAVSIPLADLHEILNRTWQNSKCEPSQLKH